MGRKDKGKAVTDAGAHRIHIHTQHSDHKCYGHIHYILTQDEREREREAETALLRQQLMSLQQEMEEEREMRARRETERDTSGGVRDGDREMDSPGTKMLAAGGGRGGRGHDQACAIPEEKNAGAMPHTCMYRERVCIQICIPIEIRLCACMCQ